MSIKKVVTLALSLFLVSCSYMLDWSTGDLISSKGGGKGLFSEKTTIDASTIRTSILQSCASCHSGQNSPNLYTMDDIRNSISKVVDAVNADRMPPASVGGPLNECQKKILAAWVEAGMPQSSSQTVGDLGEACGVQSKPPKEEPVTPPTEPEKSILDMPLNYDTLNEKILKPRCLHCHNAASDSDAAETLLFPYNELVSQTSLIGDTIEKSDFFQAVSATDGNRMPPPDESGPLSQDEIEFIKRWIEAGHPEK